MSDNPREQETRRIRRVLVICAPMEIRTPVLTLKGSRPGPLDDGGEAFSLVEDLRANERTDFIIRLHGGQAKDAELPAHYVNKPDLSDAGGLFLLNLLTKERNEANLAAVDEHAPSLHAKTRRQDSREAAVIERDEAR